MRPPTKTIVTAALVGLLALGLAVPALAADTDAAPGGAWGGICRGTGAVAGAISELLGLSSDEIAAERQAGKSLVDIAAGKDVSKDELVTALLGPRKAAIAQAVADGKISQERADLMLENMEARITERVSDPAVGPRGGAGRNGAGCGLGAGNGGGQGLGGGAGQGMRFGAGGSQL
jgi:hypothetical protein